MSNTTPATAPITNPGGSAATPTSASGFAAAIAAANTGNIYANMVTNTNTTNFTATSPQDVEALVNATMQSLVGRNATQQEIQTYGAELLAAERSNVGTFNELTKYGPTGKRADVTGQQTSTGIDPNAYLQNLISGSADAQSYKMATGYFDAMTQALQQQESE
jgi:ABC-type oligopeptide transport system substrate-binding subunit